MKEHHAWDQIKLESPFFYITEYEIACSICWHKGPESFFIHYTGKTVRTPTGIAPTIGCVKCPSCGAREETSLGIRIQNFLYSRAGKDLHVQEDFTLTTFAATRPVRHNRGGQRIGTAGMYELRTGVRSCRICS